MDGGIFHTVRIVRVMLVSRMCEILIYNISWTCSWNSCPLLSFAILDIIFIFWLVRRNCLYTGLCVGVYIYNMSSWVPCNFKIQSCTKSHQFIPCCDSFISQSVWNVRSCLPDRVSHGRRWFSFARSTETRPYSQQLARTWRTSLWLPDRSVNKPFQPLPSGNLL